ncbi:hypothetical protein CYY_002508 [Polysphondylium violaceum]|uniref:N-acetyltransferase domain-containing protein n=1 Tax=Polysphondylium violaceum TaxID=133409 RepID=A0A8J4PY07_9MYCE|nr:hypothetical protein CYY_002508 [Polysphondylium violaceum]
MVEIKDLSQETLVPFLTKLISSEETLELRDDFNNDTKNYQFALYTVNDELMGGVTGKQSFNSMHVSLLGVDKSLRGKGYGKLLMEKMESIARSENLNHITVTTLSSQAPDFYKSLGFTEIGRINDFPIKGSQKIYLVKYLK